MHFFIGKFGVKGDVFVVFFLLLCSNVVDRRSSIDVLDVLDVLVLLSSSSQMCCHRSLDLSKFIPDLSFL